MLIPFAILVVVPIRSLFDCHLVEIIIISCILSEVLKACNSGYEPLPIGLQTIHRCSRLSDSQLPLLMSMLLILIAQDS